MTSLKNNTPNISLIWVNFEHNRKKQTLASLAPTSFWTCLLISMSVLFPKSMMGMSSPAHSCKRKTRKWYVSRNAKITFLFCSWTELEQQERNNVKQNLCKVLLLSYLYTCQPLPDCGETLLSGYIIHHNHTISFAKELFGDASIPTPRTGGDGPVSCYYFFSIPLCFECIFKTC